MTNLLQRTLTGSLIVAIIIFCVWCSDLSTYLLFSLVTIFCLIEYFKMIHGKNKFWVILFSILGLIVFNGALYAIENLNFNMQIALISLAMVGIASLEFLIRPGKTSVTIGTKNLWGILYIAFPFALACLLRPDFENQREVLLGFFILQWSADSFAYLVGSKFGKTKLAPNISPKKTWEGFIGGAILTILIGCLLSLFFDQLSTLQWIIISLLVSFFGTIGDLFESRLKRHFGIKDSGNFLPGHGGFLDRFDGVLFSMPVVYSYIHFFVL